MRQMISRLWPTLLGSFSIVVLMAAVGLGVVFSQDEAVVADCDLEAIAEEISIYVTALPLVEDPWNALDVIDDLVSVARIECFGMSFSSEVDGRQPVLGPILVPDGLYRVRANTEGFFQLTIMVLGGDCDIGGFGDLMFNEFAGDANPVETLLDAENDCEAMFTVSLADEEWTLEFEKIR